MTKLKRSHDKESPCLKPRTLSKASEGSIPTLTALQKVLNIILHSLINFAGISCADIAVKNTIPYGAIKGSLIVEKKMVCVGLFCVGLFQDVV